MGSYQFSLIIPLYIKGLQEVGELAVYKNILISIDDQQSNIGLGE
jgi:hypothetical protein